MKVRALRGVCIGVEQHLAAGDEADLDAAQVQFLASIGAVERVTEAPVAPVAAPEAPALAPSSETPTPAKPGKKEK